jgi:hypothetical protein
VAKTLYLSSQNTVNYYKSFCSVSKFWITNTTFFLSWNICFIISLISIINLTLIYNYNIIKYIYFINQQQHANIPCHKCVIHGCHRKTEKWVSYTTDTPICLIDFLFNFNSFSTLIRSASFKMLRVNWCLIFVLNKY